MKKTSYLITALIYFLFLSVFNGKAQKPHAPDRKRQLAFFDSNMLKKIEEDKEGYLILKRDFSLLRIEDFYRYSGDFLSTFSIASPPLTFSIYEKYNGFQSVLDLQDHESIEPGPPQETYTKMIRIYPAIDAGNNFYLVMLKEKRKKNPAATDSCTTITETFYAVRQAAFSGLGPVLTGSVRTTREDILRFQATFNRITNGPGGRFTYNKEMSFSYSIEKYDLLLGSDAGFWNVKAEQGSKTSQVVVRIFPGIDRDDPNHVKFRLMFRLYLYDIPTDTYQEIQGKGIFDNIDPCPNVCPFSTTAIKP